jgi:hypothetical protein
MMRKQLNFVLKNPKIRNYLTPSQIFLSTLLNKNLEVSKEFMETIKHENANLYEYSGEFINLKREKTVENQLKAFKFLQGKKNEKVDVDCVKLEIEMSTNLNSVEREKVVLLIALKHIDDIIFENATEEASNLRLSILLILTTIYFRREEKELSEKYAKKTRDYYLDLPKDNLNVGDQLFLLTAYSTLISFYFDNRKDEEEAEKLFDEIYQISIDIETAEFTILEHLAVIHMFGAKIFIEQNQIEKVEKIIKKGIEITEKIGFNVNKLDLYQGLIGINLKRNLDLCEEYLIKSEKVIEHLMSTEVSTENVDRLIVYHFQLSLEIYRYDKPKIILIYEDLINFVEGKKIFENLKYAIVGEFMDKLLDMKEYEKAEDLYFKNEDFKEVISKVVLRRVKKVRDLQSGETDFESIPMEELRFASKISLDSFKLYFTRCSIL